MLRMGLVRASLLLAGFAVAAVSCGPQSTLAPSGPTSEPTTAATPTLSAQSDGTSPEATPSPALEEQGTPVPEPGEPGDASPTPSPDLSAGVSPALEPVGSVPEDGSDAGCVSNPNPVFTSHITELDNISFIIPTIVSSGNWLKNRSYLIVAEVNGSAPELPVYAPVDATLTSITNYLGKMTDRTTGQPFDLAQFDIRFQVSCEVGFMFDHVGRLVEPLASLANPEPAADTRDAAVYTALDVKAGQLLGYASGTVPAHTWDFIVTNSTVTNSFANQARYETQGELVTLLHNDCPYRYFPEGIGNEYLAFFGGWNGGVVGAGDCPGSPDLAGTISGAWFKTPFDPSAGSFFVPDWGVVVVMTPDGAVDANSGSATVRTHTDGPTSVDPKTVTTSHCYEDAYASRYAFLELVSEDVLAAAFGDGTCPASLPASHTLYYR